MHSASLKMFGALAVTMVVASPALAQRMERGAFLRHPAKSRVQLLAQLRSDPIVAARYARHFGMTDQQLTRYFGTLTHSTIPTTRRYLVWHINPDGTIGSRNLLLKKGTGVFVDRHGRIVLKESCGNPMVSGDYARRDVTESKPATPAPTEVAMIQPAPPEVVPTQPDIIPPVEVVPPPVIEATPPIVEAAPPVVVPSTVTATAPPIAPIPIASGSGSNWLPLLAIPIIGGVALGGHGGGGDHHTPPPVPEPTSIVALTAGVGLVMARRKRKKE